MRSRSAGWIRDFGEFGKIPQLEASIYDDCLVRIKMLCSSVIIDVDFIQTCSYDVNGINWGRSF